MCVQIQIYPILRRKHSYSNKRFYDSDVIKMLAFLYVIYYFLSLVDAFCKTFDIPNSTICTLLFPLLVSLFV